MSPYTLGTVGVQNRPVRGEEDETEWGTFDPGRKDRISLPVQLGQLCWLCLVGDPLAQSDLGLVRGSTFLCQRTTRRLTATLALEAELGDEPYCWSPDWPASTWSAPETGVLVSGT
jgi:hypothetical protein